MRRALDLDIFDFVLRVGRQEEFKKLLESLVESLQEVADANVLESVLEQDEVAMSACPVGRRLVIEVWEVIVFEPISESRG